MATAEERTGSGDSGSSRCRRVLLFPLPFEGHLNPMFQLAGVLHSRGLAITVFHATFNAPDPARHPGYRFVPVDHGGELAAGCDDYVAIILALNERLQARFEGSLGEALSAAAAAGEDVACLVVDSNFRAMQEAAARLGVPTLVLRTGSAASVNAYMAYPLLCQKGYLPIHDLSQLDMPLSELPPLRLGDMRYSTVTSHAMMRRCLDGIVESMRSSSGVVFNTFDALEHAELQKIAGELPVPVFPVGPLHKFAPIESSLLPPDPSCLQWLDAQPTDAVLYVSFGSLATLDPSRLVEVAWGLALSGESFLWVARPGLPEGCEQAVRGRGRVVGWAPQRDVLRHRAVGGFWTHCGWNSTLESVCEGVPMLCAPQFADQMGNARYAQEVWGVGLALEGEVERGRVAEAVRRLMRGREGAKRRRRARELEREAARCVEMGGSSRAAVGLLVDHVLSLRVLD